MRANIYIEVTNRPDMTGQACESLHVRSSHEINPSSGLCLSVCTSESDMTRPTSFCLTEWTTQYTTGGRDRQATRTEQTRSMPSSNISCTAKHQPDLSF